MKLEQLISNYLIMCKIQNNLNDKTVKAYKLDLSQFYDYVKNEEKFYTKDILVDYVYFLNKKEYKIKTLKRKIASLKAFFSYLNYEELIDLNPFSKIRLKLKEPLLLPKIIPLNMLQDLFQLIYNEKENCKKNTYAYIEVIRNIIILELLISTGIRISELCGLKKINIDNYKCTIKIYGKGAKERIIPIFDKYLWNLIIEYTYLYSNKFMENEYFFINKRGNKISDQSIRDMIKKYSKKANIDLNITPHMFRHTFATMLLEDDVDVRYIQQLLGHSNIVTTQIYTHITSNKKSEILKFKNPRGKVVLNKG